MPIGFGSLTTFLCLAPIFQAEELSSTNMELDSEDAFIFNTNTTVVEHTISVKWEISITTGGVI
jgi:hypothetical protein